MVCKRKKCRQQPGCLYLWCIAHRLELAVLHAVKHDDYLSEFEDIINNIFFMYYLSPKLRQEFNVLGQQLDKITKEFGGLKWVRWLASRFRAIFMLANNYKVLCFHLQNISNYGDTAKCCKSRRFSSKNSNPKNLWLTYISSWICFRLYEKCH